MFWLLFASCSIFFAFFGKIELVKNPVVAKISRVCLVATLSVVLATCGSVFTDHDYYVSAFIKISRIETLPIDGPFDFFFNKYEGTASPLEKGFVLLYRLISNLGFSEIGFFFIIGFITNLLVISTFYRFKYPVIAVIVYITSTYFAQEFNLVRQCLAISIIFYALKYLEEKRWKKYLLFVLVAFTIHQSSLLGLLLLPFCFINDSPKALSYIKLVFLPFYLFSLLVATKRIDFDLSLIGGAIGVYEGYLGNDDNVGVGERSVDIVFNFMAVVCFLFYKRNHGKYIYAMCLFLGAILTNLTTQTPNLLRLALYFSFAYCVFVPHMLGNLSILKNKMVGFFSLALLTTYHILLIVNWMVNGTNIIGTKIDSLIMFK